MQSLYDFLWGAIVLAVLLCEVVNKVPIITVVVPLCDSEQGDVEGLQERSACTYSPLEAAASEGQYGAGGGSERHFFGAAVHEGEVHLLLGRWDWEAVRWQVRNRAFSALAPHHCYRSFMIKWMHKAVECAVVWGSVHSAHAAG